MDLRGHFRKIRQLESSIAEPFVVVYSFDTVDGGREGVLTEVSRYLAAKLIVDGRARLADPDEVAQFQQQTEQARQRAMESHATRLQGSVLSETDIRAIKTALRPQKG